MQRAAGSDGAADEVDLASMDTVASLLASLKTQASMFVSLAKSGASAAGASSSSSKAKASGGKLDAAKLQRGDTLVDTHTNACQHGYIREMARRRSVEECGAEIGHLNHTAYANLEA
jgi:hypothetical protein